MSMLLQVFPDELVIRLLVYLNGPDIRSSQLVCRRFANIVKLSPILRFIVELDHAGYAESSNPRTDITLEEKCAILRLHNSRRRNQTVTRTDRLKLGVPSRQLSAEHHPLTLTWAMLHKDGVLTCWSSVQPNSYTPLQLDVVQLALLNTGLDLKQWRLVQRDMNIREYNIEPACNLLVLLEYTGPHPFDSTMPSGSNVHDRYKFHFRTLSTNEVHPSAVSETFDCGLQTGDGWGFRIQCMGDILIAYPQHEQDSETTQRSEQIRLLIYNWTTGAFLDLRDANLSRLLVVLSKDVMVVPRSTFTYGSRDSPMGYLDLYSIDWSDSPSISLAATLELPVVHSIPMPPFGLHGITMAHTAISLCCFAGVGFCSSGPAPYARGSPRVFEPTMSNQLLRLQITLPYVKRVLEARSHVWSCVQIPVDVIYNAMKSSRLYASSYGTSRPVAWEHWGPKTRWIHSDLAQVAAGYGNQPLGSRCMLSKQVRDRDLNTRIDVYLFDFNPHFLKEIRQCGSRADMSDTQQTAGFAKWVYQPEEPNDMTPNATHADPHSWLAASAADQAVAPYVWSQVEHEQLNHAAAQANHGIAIVWDNEHIVVIQGNPMADVLVLTF